MYNSKMNLTKNLIFIFLKWKFMQIPPLRKIARKFESQKWIMTQDGLLIYFAIWKLLWTLNLTKSWLLVLEMAFDLNGSSFVIQAKDISSTWEDTEIW